MKKVSTPNIADHIYARLIELSRKPRNWGKQFYVLVSPRTYYTLQCILSPSMHYDMKIYGARVIVTDRIDTAFKVVS